MTRNYNFEFPVHLSGVEAFSAPSIIEQKGLWDKIPKSIKDKLNNASVWSGTDITKEDLDQIDDQTWEEIKTYIASDRQIT